MLRYDTKAWWKLIFQFHEGDTLRTLLPNISIVALTGLIARNAHEILVAYPVYRSAEMTGRT